VSIPSSFLSVDYITWHWPVAGGQWQVGSCTKFRMLLIRGNKSEAFSCVHLFIHFIRGLYSQALAGSWWQVGSCTKFRMPLIKGNKSEAFFLCPSLYPFYPWTI